MANQVSTPANWWDWLLTPLSGTVAVAEKGVDVVNMFRSGKTSYELANSVNSNETAGTYTDDDLRREKINTFATIGVSVVGFLGVLWLMRKVLKG